MRAKPDGWLMPKVQPTTGPKDPIVKQAVKADAKGDHRRYEVTPEDMEALRQRHVETMQDRQRYADLNLRRTLEAAPKLTGRSG